MAVEGEYQKISTMVPSQQAQECHNVLQDVVGLQISTKAIFNSKCHTVSWYQHN
jgi:hypothetical protein